MCRNTMFVKQTSWGCDNQPYMLKFSSKGLEHKSTRKFWRRTSGKYRRVLEEAVNLTSTNRRFRTVNYMVAMEKIYLLLSKQTSLR